jgi:hypothetical protein
LGTTWIASKKEYDMPALQLAGIRQFIGGIFIPLFMYKRGWPRKTMENNHHFKYS